jgi:uncharacterized protein (TIGR03067 family)
MRLITALSVAAVALLASLTLADGPREGKAGAADLIGSYRVVAGERNGDEIAADRLKGVTVRIAANAITTLDNKEKEVYVATYKLDTGRKPWRITMTATVAPAGGEGTRAVGLIARDGDTVKLIYALPGGEAPAEFKTGDRQQMFVLKRTGK